MLVNFHLPQTPARIRGWRLSTLKTENINKSLHSHQRSVGPPAAATPCRRPRAPIQSVSPLGTDGGVIRHRQQNATMAALIPNPSVIKSGEYERGDHRRQIPLRGNTVARKNLIATGNLLTAMFGDGRRRVYALNTRASTATEFVSF